MKLMRYLIRFNTTRKRMLWKILGKCRFEIITVYSDSIETSNQ
jgi:hypothetical protein